MSMEVSSNYRDYKNDYLDELREGQEKAREAGKKQDTEDKMESIPVPIDEYISSEQSGGRPSGLYHMGKDQNGNPKVLYDDPKKANGPDEKGQPKAPKDIPAEDEERCTTNTDRVDREIKNLKNAKIQLEQQIKAASEDEQKVKELEKKLRQVESELSQKDNDTYRRQNAEIS